MTLGARSLDLDVRIEAPRAPTQGTDFDMDRSFYIDLARDRRRLPLITHMVLHEKEDPESILRDGERLAAVMLETAERLGSPMAFPVMDLSLEKDILLQTMGVPAEATAAFHFDSAPLRSNAPKSRRIST